MNKFGTQDRFSRFGQIKRVGKLGKYGASFYTRINSGNVNIGPQSSPPVAFGGVPDPGLDLTTPEEPTRVNTGFRMADTDLVAWTDSYKFKNPGLGHTSVLPTGLTVTGVRFTSKVQIYTDNPITFIDCHFLDDADQEPSMGNYLLQSYSNDTQNTGRKLVCSYCTFRGGKGPQINSTFKKLFKCSFNYTLSDYIRFQTHTSARNIHDFLIEGCWFGPLVNIQDGPSNNGNGMYAPGTQSPHADNGQIYSSDPRKITYKRCTIHWTADQWTDGTINPNNNLGANPDKLFQFSGGSTIATSCDILELDRCWIYGSGNSWVAMRNTLPKNVFGHWTTFEIRFLSNIFALDANGGSWSYNFDSDPTSGNFMNFTRVTDGNNKFMRTDSVSLRLPQEAIDAGTQVSHSGGGQSDIFSCENWLFGLDTLSFSQAGLNEGGKTSFDRRSTPA